MKVGIGQLFMFKEDFEIEGIMGTNVVLKEGTIFQVSADRFLITRDGKCIAPDDSMEIEGYSAKGIADKIYEKLDLKFGVGDVLEMEYGITSEEDVKNTIIDALEELSFYDHTGNIS